jgi:hypothetical protein
MKITQIDHTHISHFDIKSDDGVIEHPDLIQLTGTLGACRRVAYYFGLTREQFRNGDGSIPSDDIYNLVTVDGKKVGQIHECGKTSLVLYAKYFVGHVA